MNNAQTLETTETQNETVFEMPKSETEIYRISIRKYKGVSYVDLRIFFSEKATGEFRPTKKGLTFRKEFLSGIAQGLCQAEELIPQEK
jgi:hypothetical protein